MLVLVVHRLKSHGVQEAFKLHSQLLRPWLEPVYNITCSTNYNEVHKLTLM
jgi:hypothetical protein